MEGLIPFIYKTIKERRTRSYYSRCSSTGSSRGRFGGRVEDSSWDQQKQWESGGGGGKVTTVEREMAHRRYRSLEELAGEVGVGASPEWRRRPGALALRRGRSARIFSCIGGM